MEYELLNKIQSPIDVKRLKINKLDKLSEEVRDKIINTVSNNGGHIASSLGAVEIAVALHYVFTTPLDKLVWDVGHQSYAHKLLTGRFSNFDTLRTKNGISGFTNRFESKHDSFGAGHSSTSISAALGLAEAKKLKNERGKVIAIIGDGSLTSGLAFEGLNNAGALKRDLIVVLNDNEMSISPNVGALSSWFSKKYSGTTISRLRRHVKDLLISAGNPGEDILKILRKGVESTKVLLTPGLLFEGFGFNYVGPIDGNNIKELVDVFKASQKSHEPLLIHTRTVKGKGYKPAEKSPTKFHGIGAFNIETGEIYKSNNKDLSYSDIFGNALVEAAEKNDRVVAITAAMTEGTGLQKFREQFPDRFYDVGITEGHAVVFAAALAAEPPSPKTVVAASLSHSIKLSVTDCAPSLSRSKSGSIKVKIISEPIK